MKLSSRHHEIFILPRVFGEGRGRSFRDRECRGGWRRPLSHDPTRILRLLTLMGTLPIALGIGAGAESRRPLGITVVGGLLFSQVFTLYLTPKFYDYMETWREEMLERDHNIIGQST